MADTNHAHTGSPVEGDGVSYAGIVWFIVILTATTVFCQLIVWGAFVLMERIHPSGERAPLSAPAARPTVGKDESAGRVLTGTEIAPAPGLLVNEPAALSVFRAKEDASLKSYAWIDRTNGIVRIPIDRAKALIAERGLPVRSASPPAGATPVAAARGGR
jgi:hypothetical protein